MKEADGTSRLIRLPKGGVSADLQRRYGGKPVELQKQYGSGLEKSRAIETARQPRDLKRQPLESTGSLPLKTNPSSAPSTARISSSRPSHASNRGATEQTMRPPNGLDQPAVLRTNGSAQAPSRVAHSRPLSRSDPLETKRSQATSPVGKTEAQGQSATTLARLQAFEEEELLKRRAHEAEMARKAAMQDLDLEAEVRRRQAVQDLEFRHEQRMLQMRQRYSAPDDTASADDVVVIKAKPMSPRREP